MAAMLPRVPCGPQGQRAIASAKTRFKSRTQLQRGELGAGLWLVDALLAGWRGDRTAPAAVGRQTAAIAHQVDARQGHERCQLLQEFHRREANSRGLTGPRVGEGSAIPCHRASGATGWKGKGRNAEGRGRDPAGDTCPAPGERRFFGLPILGALAKPSRKRIAELTTRL